MVERCGIVVAVVREQCGELCTRRSLMSGGTCRTKMAQSHVWWDVPNKDGAAEGDHNRYAAEKVTETESQESRTAAVAQMAVGSSKLGLDWPLRWLCPAGAMDCGALSGGAEVAM